MLVPLPKSCKPVGGVNSTLLAAKMDQENSLMVRENLDGTAREAVAGLARGDGGGERDGSYGV